MDHSGAHDSLSVTTPLRVTPLERNWLREQLRLATGATVEAGAGPTADIEARLLSSMTGAPAASGGDQLGSIPFLPTVDGRVGPSGHPEFSLEAWPEGRPFALFLSHDVDQIHDREMFRIMADCNHMRRVLMHGEPGSLRLASSRIVRSLMRPKPVTQDFETLVNIEGRHGFRSTYFLLHDRYWARNGARYRISDPGIHEVGNLVKQAGHELAVHGGYYRFNDPIAYAESKEVIGRLFDCDPVGIRNHLLRFSYPETWRAQERAGFSYDATYGSSRTPGPRSQLPFPFWVFDRTHQRELDLLALPLTLMDTTLFRSLGRKGEEALEVALQIVRRVMDAGGLVSLLWHNNYFNEPEYRDWQWVYEELLAELARHRPWCGTGAEINYWWRARAALATRLDSTADGWTLELNSPYRLRGLTLSVGPADLVSEIGLAGTEADIVRCDDRWQVRLGELEGATVLKIGLSS